MPVPMTTNGQYQNFLTKQEVVRVRGENGARALQMGPNCSALLLDDTNPIVWLVQTDGAGYKTVSPFSITPYEPAPAVDVNSLADRISKLEEKVNESYHFSNEQTSNKSSANKTNVEQSKGNK